MEALKDCLARIRGVHFDKIIVGYPSSEKGKEEKERQ